MELHNLLLELQYNDMVCGCHQVQVKDLLDKAKFKTGTTEDLLKELKIGTSCGVCTNRTKAEKDTKGKCESFYADVLRLTKEEESKLFNK